MIETKLTFDSFPNEDQARTDSSKAGGGDRLQLESVTLRWADDEHGPMLYTNSKITMWEDGKWAYSHTVKNRSEHSDWDVWIDPLFLKVKDGELVAVLKAGEVCFQDLDSGEEYTKADTGYSNDIVFGWRFIRDGYWIASRTKWKRRDN